MIGVKLLVLFIIIGFFMLINIANAYNNSKNVTLELYKNDLGYCYFNGKNAVCNYIEIDNKMRLIDSFLQFLINGKCDK